jgi:methylthioribose-1-phosphate isomerase
MPTSKQSSAYKPIPLSGFPQTLSWNGTSLRLIDQTRLPEIETYIDVTSVVVLEDCIKRLVVRGAPAIGCAGAFGTVLVARAIESDLPGERWLAEFDARCAKLAAVRPTAVNLQWAVQRCQKTARKLAQNGCPRAEVLAGIEKEAVAICDEDREMCERIGRHGATLLRQLAGTRKRITAMTHCNAGALATAGAGTALAVFYAAQQEGLELSVFADETRPLLQGARLTAWELSRAGIGVTVICDNMAASVMRDRRPDAVVVGADRIAANGDTANKIGTYGLAILARHHGLPFYVAAPYSTFDLSLKTGAEIRIEERSRDEISHSNGKLSVPDKAGIFNPAFDVTPIELIAGHITEKGVLKPPFL